MPFEKFRDQVKSITGEYSKYIEVPKIENAGDLALPCFIPAKQLGKNPAELAKMLEVDFNRSLKKYPLIREIKSLGPYVNFYLNEKVFVPLVVKEVIVKKGRYGSSSEGRGKTVVVEYPSANVAKPMSVGHLRSAIIGQALYNIYRFLGYKVISDDHQGDWGTQFGKLLCAYSMWGDRTKIEKNPIRELLDLYVRFHEEAEKNPGLEDEARKWFSRLEKGDRDATRLWKMFRDVSLKDFRKIYARLGLKLDYMLGESFYIGMAKAVIKEALDKGIAKSDSGAVIIPMNGHPLLIQKSDESTLYATRDLATIKYRIYKFRPHKILYVVGSEQSLYFRQVFFAAQKLGYMKDEGVHVSFGLVSLPEGRMSTRSGRVVFLEDLINETLKYAERVINEKNPDLADKKGVAELVALAAIKYNDLSRDRIKNIVFDWKEALSFEGDTGPYLQYTAVRANSILKKSKKKISKAGLDALTEKSEVEIAKILSKFYESVKSAANEYKPHYIACYLNTLAAKFNEYYHRTKIIGSENEKQRLALVLSVATVMKTGLALLGIEVPEEM